MERKTLVMFGMLALAAAVVISGCTQTSTQNTQTNVSTPSGAAVSSSTLASVLAAGAGGQTSDYDLISTQDTISSP